MTTPPKHLIALLSPGMRELLFSNITLEIDLIKDIAEKLSEGLPSVVEAIKEQLTQNIVSERKAAIDNPSRQEELCAKAKKHISSWVQAFGEVSLADVLKLSQVFNISAPSVLDRSMVTPAAIKDCLSQYVVGQDEYVSKLSLAFYTHYLRSYYSEEFGSLPQASMLAFGPTGSGKTYALQVLSKLFNIPLGIVNCNALVATGIVGQSFPSVFTELYRKNNKQVSQVERSIILIDEIDKIDEDLVNELLSITDDDGQILFNDTHGNRNYDSIQISTRGIMFVYTGVFDNLRRVVEKRMNLNVVGYATAIREKEGFCFYDHLSLDDFRCSNLKPEILGRIRDCVHVREHTQDTIMEILMCSVESPFLAYKNYFEKHSICLSIEESGAKAIAEQVIKKALGARGLKTMLWHLLSREMADVTTKREIVINQKYVESK